MTGKYLASAHSLTRGKILCDHSLRGLPTHQDVITWTCSCPTQLCLGQKQQCKRKEKGPRMPHSWPVGTVFHLWLVGEILLLQISHKKPGTSVAAQHPTEWSLTVLASLNISSVYTGVSCPLKYPSSAKFGNCRSEGGLHINIQQCT